MKVSKILMAIKKETNTQIRNNATESKCAPYCTDHHDADH